MALEPAAQAQGSFQSSPLGGRSVLLGGTGTALGVDGAAPFLNPATVSRIEDTSIAFSSKFFRYTRRTVKRWEQPGAIDHTLFDGLDLGNASTTQEQMATVPDTTCFFMGQKKRPKSTDSGVKAPGTHTIAFCMGKVEDSQFTVSAEPFHSVSNSYIVSRSRSRSDTWSRWNAGPTWSHGMTDRLSVGISVHASRAYYERSLSLGTVVEDQTRGLATSSSYQAAAEGYSWDLLATVGATYKVTDAVTIGLSLRSPSAHLTDDFNATYSSGGSVGAQSAGVYAWEGHGTFVARSPARVALGVAAEWTRIRAELDGFFYPGMGALARADLDQELVHVGPTGVVARGRSQLAFVEESNPVVNVGAGAEIFLNKDLSLLFGLLTDFSAIPAFSAEVDGAQKLFMERKSAIHASMGMVSYTQYGDLIAGIRFDAGAGQMRSANSFSSPARLDPVDFTEVGGMFVLAGRISLRTLTGTVKSLESAAESVKPVDKPTEPMRAPVRKE